MHASTSLTNNGQILTPYDKSGMEISGAKHTPSKGGSMAEKHGSFCVLFPSKQRAEHNASLPVVHLLIGNHDIFFAGSAENTRPLRTLRGNNPAASFGPCLAPGPLFFEEGQLNKTKGAAIMARALTPEQAVSDLFPISDALLEIASTLDTDRPGVTALVLCLAHQLRDCAEALDTAFPGPIQDAGKEGGHA